MNVIQRIQQFNQGRDPQLLQTKYQKMSRNAFTFLRGTCHLFYEDWQADARLQSAPLTWISGDLHLENFGSYPGRDGVLYFNINDFDEAVLAPCTWELVRFLTAILVAAPLLQVSAAEAQQLCQAALAAYAQTLATGIAASMQAQTTTGVVQTLLHEMAQLDRASFLNKHTELAGQRRRFRSGDKKLLPVAKPTQKTIAVLMKQWAARQKYPERFQVLDIAYRVAGTGSLGLERYAVLVAGGGTPDQNQILDLKRARSSALKPNLLPPASSSQPRWRSEAKRIINVQREVLSTPPELLTGVKLGKRSLILRELQPGQGEVELQAVQGDREKIAQLLSTMATVTAYGHLRGSGWQGAALVADLIAFAHDRAWQTPLLNTAQICAGRVEQEFQTFRAAVQSEPALP